MPDSKELTDISSQLKKTVISAQKFKKGSSFDTSKSILNIHKTMSTLAGHTRKLAIRIGSVEKSIDNNSRKITLLKNLSEKQSERISGTNIGAKLPGSSSSNVEDNISAITKSVSSIAEILSGRKKLADSTAAYDKRKAEQEKRALAESKLEKRFEGLKNAAEKVIAPVKSILDRILEFFTTVILGRIVFKLIEWFGNKDNADKVRSIIRFLGDHWPKLLALYLTFGTSFGKFARGLVKLVARAAFKLAALIFKLAAAKKVRGARRAAGFLGGRGGRAVSAVIGTAVTLGGTYAATQALKGPDEEPKAQAYKGGGYVIPKIPTFKGGGFNFKGMLGGASLGAMFGPLGMLLGGAFGSGKPQEMVSGFVSGEKGVDKIPAMLSDGEFVMSRGAVAKYGVDTLEAMNAAGGGTNKPRIVSGTAYAAGGGPIGEMPISFDYGQNPDVNQMRRAARLFADNSSSSPRFGTEDELFKAFKKLGYIPDIRKMVGGDNFLRISQGHAGYDDALDAIRKSVADKVKAVNNPQSFTQSSRAAAGLDDLAKRFDMDAKTAPRYGENLPRLGRPKPTSTLKPKIPTLASELSPSYFLRGQSSLLPENYFLRGQSSLVPQPKPQASAFNRYRPGATIRATGPGMERFAELQRFASAEGALSKTPKSSRGGIAGTILMSLAEIFKPQIQAAVGDLYDKMGIGLGNLSNAELKKQLEEQTKRVQKLQSGPMGQFMDESGETERLQFLQQEANKRRIAGLKGGKIVGGYGLKEQSFKDAPKTQIMTDEKGRPFVGYKAMRNGKLFYVRGPQPGTGTSNPLEALGRMINPGAYKDVDAASERQKYEEASRNSLASLKARGATQANIAKTQAELNKRKPVSPPPKPQAKPQSSYVKNITARQNARRGGGGSTTPNFGATCPKNGNAKRKILGIF